MALASVASAEDATLVWDWSFNSRNQHVVVDADGDAYSTLSFTWNGAQVSNSICTTKNSGGSAIKLTVKDSNSPLTMGDSFSFVMQGGAVDNPSDWGVLFGMGHENNESKCPNNFKVSDTNAGKLAVYPEGGYTLTPDKDLYSTPVFTTVYGEMGTYIVTVQAGENNSQFTLYYNGNEVYSGALSFGNAASEKLSVFSFGGRPLDDNNKAAISFTNVQLYSGVLSKSQISQLSVPEPTTATLSLLALAGLAARRRRASR